MEQGTKGLVWELDGELEAVEVGVGALMDPRWQRRRGQWLGTHSGGFAPATAPTATTAAAEASSATPHWRRGSFA